MLEKTVVLGNWNDFYVFNENGTLYSRFVSEKGHQFGDVFHREGQIIGMSKHGLYSYDYQGNILWENHECFSEDLGQIVFNDKRNEITASKDSILVLYSELRNDNKSDKVNLEKLEVFGPNTFSRNNESAHDDDLCIARIGFDGKIIEYKQIDEHCKSNGMPIVNKDKVLVFYYKNDNQGIYILNKSLDITDNIQVNKNVNIAHTRPIGLNGNRLFYAKYDLNPKKFDFNDEKYKETLNSYLQEYDLEKKIFGKEIEINHPGRFFGSNDHRFSKVIKDKLFFYSSESLYRLDCLTEKLEKFEKSVGTILNNGNMLIVEEMNPEFLTCYKRTYEEFVPEIISHFADGTKKIRKNFTQKVFGVPPELKEEYEKSLRIKRFCAIDHNLNEIWSFDQDKYFPENLFKYSTRDVLSLLHDGFIISDGKKILKISSFGDLVWFNELDKKYTYLFVPKEI